MSVATEVLLDGFGRVQEEVHAVVTGLSDDVLATCPAEGTNSIAWLVWHLTRIQDDHVAGVAGHPQVWTAGGWVGRFDLPFPEGATGYGHQASEVAAVRADSGLLRSYHDAVHAQTSQFVTVLPDEAFSRIVDRRWDPPVTLSVRLVSVLTDDLEHVGQAAYVRGLLEVR